VQARGGGRPEGDATKLRSGVLGGEAEEDDPPNEYFEEGLLKPEGSEKVLEDFFESLLFFVSRLFLWYDPPLWGGSRGC